ncbi:dihydrolipoyl dehydrogenase [candidate division WOR-3 bacterium]|nr:dihydrolipoyl dehydrogenase [candidate division WOR-3 bacterium]
MRIGIIGGGPAGYSAAIRVSNENNKVQLFEKGEIGGVCLNTGCIPTKALIYSANLYDNVKSKKQKPNWVEIQEGKALAVKRVLLGLKGLLKEKKIEIIKEEAILKGDGSVKSKDKEYKFDKVIIATGSKAMATPFTTPKDTWSSTDALEASNLPESLVIIGAGYIGLEFGYIFSCLGSKVSIVEKENEVLPGEDTESAAILRKSLMRKGIKFYLTSEVIEVKKNNEKFEVFFKNSGKEEKIQSDQVLIAIGRTPNVDDLPGQILEGNKAVKVNDFSETKIKGVYAIGDCIGNCLLAHAAFKDAEIAARNILGEKIKKDKFAIPRVAYTHPELASVGYSEEEARSQNIDYLVSRVPFASNGRAIASGKTAGQIKIIHTKEGEIIGSIILGENASELISIFSLALDNGLSLKKLSETVYPHPTFSEVIGEVSKIAEVQSI